VSKLLILTPAELTRDPRARRAARWGKESGWDVTGLCVAAGGGPVDIGGIPVVRVGGERVDATLRRAGFGGGRRDSTLLRELRGMYRLLRLARTTVAFWLAGRRIGTDVVHANDFDTLPAAWLLARAHSARLVYDAHELYTLQEADPPRIHLAVVRALERLLARRTAAVITVSEPIAAELQRLLRLPRTPLVVLNCPAKSDYAAAPEVGAGLRAIYQGAVGHGRSVDDLLDAAAAVDHVTLSLRIVGVDMAGLMAAVERRGLGSRVDVLEPVDPDALIEALTTFDVGIVITRPLTVNDRLAVPNKLFDYLMAGLAVAVPALPGVATIVDAERVGMTFEPGSSQSLAETLSALAASPADTAAMKARAREVALSRFNSETQQPVLSSAWAA
jgi:glycogen synthase